MTRLIHITFLYVIQVREQGQQKGEASPFVAELLRLEDLAKQQGLGKWSTVSSLPLSYLQSVCEILVLLSCRIYSVLSQLHAFYVL